MYMLKRRERESSLRFNGHFPGGPGLASTGMCSVWILLELRVMEVVVTTGAIRVRMSPQTNQHLTFYKPDALPVAQPTVSKH